MKNFVYKFTFEERLRNKTPPYLMEYPEGSLRFLSTIFCKSSTVDCMSLFLTLKPTIILLCASSR
jgi:hypothetical protein